MLAYRRFAVVFAGLSFFLGLETVVQAEERKPNILFICTDDQRPDTIRALGNTYIRTPNLDRLVRQGTVFTQAHCVHPLCVPSRVEILTGTSGFTNGVLALGKEKISPNVDWIAMVLQRAGYHTWYVGKWHTAGRPSTRGYTDVAGLFSSGGGRFAKDQVDYKGMKVTGYRGWIFQTDDRKKLFPEKGVGLTPYISSQFAEAAIRLIKRKSKKPFFLHVNFTAPHDPLLLPPKYEDKYQPSDIPLQPNFKAEHPFDHGNLKGRDEKMLPWPRTPQEVRKNLAVYYAVISHLDEQIGRILEALEQSGQIENTIIIFSSDHGLAVGSHGLMGKQNMYAHTILVPLIFAGPSIPRDKKSDSLVYLRDLFPTFCDFAGTDIPASVEGKSLVPVIKGKTRKIRDHVFCYFRDSQRMVRDREWKLIQYPKLDRYQLFHLLTDPHELKDLSKNPKYGDRMSQLKKRLRDWQKKVKDPVLED